MSKAELSAPRGTRDFYPDDLRLRSWLFERFREVAHRFAFEEVDAPVVEHAELYQRKAGEEIVEQLYHFQLHERHLALRPELTPSLARMVIARQGALRLPLRWFAIPQCWRYERMTRGRRREHYQWNMDVWGETDVTAEAELIAALFAATDALGLAAGDVKLRVNHRRLLEETVPEGRRAGRGLPGHLHRARQARQDRTPRRWWSSSRREARSASRAGRPGTWWRASRRAGSPTRRASPAPSSPALAELRRLFDLLDAYGARGPRRLRRLRGARPRLLHRHRVRGPRRRRARCAPWPGGGRYDGLVESLGGRPLPAVGFGFGDAVIHELLAERGKLPELPRRIDAVVYPFSEAERPDAVRLARMLRERGESVELVLAQREAETRAGRCRQGRCRANLSPRPRRTDPRRREGP